VPGMELTARRGEGLIGDDQKPALAVVMGADGFLLEGRLVGLAGDAKAAALMGGLASPEESLAVCRDLVCD
jgi:hypothetical protein